jgi:hypothetical protein
MRRIAFFVEDFAHQEFLKALVQRLADEHGEQVRVGHADASLGRFLGNMKSMFNAWKCQCG